MRGFAGIGLFQPKTPINVGGAMRAAWCYDAAFVAISGTRFKKAPTDTFASWRHIPTFRTDDLFSVVPYDCVPVAVDLIPGAIPLPEYKHPERAFYIFGPEDGTLGIKITSQCRDAIQIPMRGCSNLAATVNVVLYDRMAKGATK